MIRTLRQRLRRMLGQTVHRLANRRLPQTGFQEGRMSIPAIERLDDRSLTELNQLLPWHCFVVDSRGRRFGNVAWGGKRTAPQVIPDPRIALMDKHFRLSDKSVLEIGCFEGIHTIGLCQVAAAVKAVDARIDNVAKTMVRCGLFGQRPEVFTCDVECIPAAVPLLAADLCHHVGVLYHLRDPVSHLVDLGRYIRMGLMLDTHISEERDVADEYSAVGRSWRYRRYGEYGKRDPFSGMYDHAKWLTLPDLIAALALAGFGKTTVVEQRAERNGPRVLLFAERDADGKSAP